LGAWMIWSRETIVYSTGRCQTCRES
jgi:hypothetical protein